MMFLTKSRVSNFPRREHLFVSCDPEYKLYFSRSQHSIRVLTANQPVVKVSRSCQCLLANSKMRLLNPLNGWINLWK